MRTTITSIIVSLARWRGATTANIRLFKEDFPRAGDPVSLRKNYRSRRGIVDLFSAFAPQMGAAKGREIEGWEIHNDDDDAPSVRFDAASDPEAESLGIASEIRALHDAGVAYRDQAVVCRTHTGMARVARVLADAGIPILYMGDLFERPEIRDLLSLLALAAGPDGGGLVRVARFPEYDVPFDDVFAFIKCCQEASMPFPGALTRIEEITDLADESRTKLNLIAAHLADLTHGRSAWKCLTRYLFERSDYLLPFLADHSAVGQQRRLAIYQFLQFVRSRIDSPTDDLNADPKRELLRYIRRLEIFGDERQLREPDEWASSIDAVRIMTIHASKGLEFRTVFIPNLSKGNIPNSRNMDLCPPPDGLLSEVDPNWRAEEEECLFFVALSRAKEKLYLSRPLTSRSGKNSNPSAYLEKLKGGLPNASIDKPTWTERPGGEGYTGFSRPQPIRDAPFSPSQLELYFKCPLSYFYRHVLGLSGKRDDTAYLQFHRTVYRTVARLRDIREGGGELSEDLAQSTFDAEWAVTGPTDHFLAELYQASGREMVSNALYTMRSSGSTILAGHELNLTAGRIKLDFDLAGVETPGTNPLVIRRFKTGRPTKSEGDKDIYALLLRAAQELSGGAGSRVETLYLRDNTAAPVTMTDKVIGNRIAKYEAAMSSIADGQFHPVENEYECPRCPHYFIFSAAV